MFYKGENMFKWFKGKKKDDEKLSENKLITDENTEKILSEDDDLSENVDLNIADVDLNIASEIDVVAALNDVSIQDNNNLTKVVEDDIEKIHDIVIENEQDKKDIEDEFNEIAEPADDEKEITDLNEKVEQIEECVEEVKEKKGFFSGLFSGLEKTRKNIGSKIDNLINNYGEIDDELFEELEEILITSDISYESVMKLIDNLKIALVERKIKDASKVKDVLRDVMAESMMDENAHIDTSKPTVILVIGVNGAGKTTTIGKLASRYINDGKKVILAAADTFRAAAIDQLKVWSERAGATFIAHEEGSDPSAVIFDGLRAAKARKSDVLICDTAGRLHNKVNLMNELKKMHSIIDREYPEANKEVLLVLDATTGQNAVNQAKLFKEVADIMGLVVTKLDGTAKGGFVFSIKDELNIPVKLIGVGEKITDLRDFDAYAFASAIIETKLEEE